MITTGQIHFDIKQQFSIFYILRKAVYIECEVGECNANNATNTTKLMIKKNAFTMNRHL